MRKLTVLGAVLLSAGCTNFPQFRSSPPPPPPVAGKVPAETPSAEALVGYLNNNARLIQSIDCRELDLDAKQGIQGAGLRGWLVCQKNKNFRMAAKAIGPELDMGSNDQEFWFWIKRADPPHVYHCSYDALAKGGVRLPFPFQPEWIMEALGMAEYGPGDKYRVNTTATSYELIEDTRSAQGAPVQKVTVFQRAPAQPPYPQIIAHILRDGNGKEICGAYITEIQTDRGSGAVIPKRVRLVWPSEKMELKMKLDDVLVNDRSVDTRAARLFTRPQLPNYTPFDLARGVDQPTGQVRRTGGVVQ